MPGQKQKALYFSSPKLTRVNGCYYALLLAKFKSIPPGIKWKPEPIRIVCRNRRLCPFPIFESEAKVPYRLTFHTLLCFKIKPKLSYSNHLILIWMSVQQFENSVETELMQPLVTFLYDFLHQGSSYNFWFFNSTNDTLTLFSPTWNIPYSRFCSCSLHHIIFSNSSFSLSFNKIPQ
jgi:hypothetical protein